MEPWKEFDVSEFKKNGKQFLLGIGIGVGIFLGLYYASTFNQSTTEIEIYTKLPTALLSAGFFITFAIFGVLIPVIRVFFPKLPMPYMMSGVLVTFTTYLVYNAITDPIHYVPFLKNLIPKSLNGTD